MCVSLLCPLHRILFQHHIVRLSHQGRIVERTINVDRCGKRRPDAERGPASEGQFATIG